MNEHQAAFELRCAAGTDIGRVRTSNEDRAYAGHRLLAVADGAAGPGGVEASAAVISVLAQLDAEPSGAAVNAGSDGASAGVGSGGASEGVGSRMVLVDATRAADDAVRQVGSRIGRAPVSTLTALLCTGDRFELVQVGDTRAYRWRDGELTQLTRDDSFVQTMVDEGRLDPAQASTHRQRALLTQALDGTGSVRPAFATHPLVAYDRYLLCSDGVWAVVPDDALAAAVAAGDDPDQAVRAVIDLANRAGAPDNLACAVVDVVPS